MRQHQFAKKDIDHQPDEYFEYFDQLNQLVNGLKDTNPSNISSLISDIESKMKEPIPSIKVDKLEPSAKNKVRITQYFNDYLTQISDFYESFILLAHYILILFKLLDGKEVDRDVQKVSKGEKVSVDRLYMRRDSNR